MEGLLLLASPEMFGPPAHRLCLALGTDGDYIVARSLPFRACCVAVQQIAGGTCMTTCVLSVHTVTVVDSQA